VSETIEWFEAVEKVRPYIVRILTPYGSGTGFIISHSVAGDVYGIATAAHVVAQAHDWELPIKIEHFDSGFQVTVRHSERAIFIDSNRDSAAVVFQPGDVKLPPSPPSLIDEGKILKVGVEIGWLGFPAVSPQNLCFFSGPISSHLEGDSGYLVDGVAINGVSGGPALWLGYKEFRYIGVVSAYIPNRATGEPLPGLAVVRDVSQFYDIIKRFRSVDEARNQQPAPQPHDPSPEPPPVAPPANPA